MKFHLSVKWFISILYPFSLHAVVGIPDVTPAATLIVPFFEVGVNSAENSENTLLVVTNISPTTEIVHYHIWNVDGIASSIYGNVQLQGGSSWSVSLRDIFSSTSSDYLEAIREGDFYRGFITIDLVTEATDLNPMAPAFPFKNLNVLEGFAYYVRLPEGSSNGINMIHLEAVGESLPDRLKGFYVANSGKGVRERIDARARLCSKRLTVNLDASDCLGDGDNDIDPDRVIDRLHARVFLNEDLYGKSRIVVFLWNTTRPNEGGPSWQCENLGGLNCSVTYTLTRYLENGEVADSYEIRLDDVVNIIEIEDPNLVGDKSGFVSIKDIPDVDRSLQVFLFSINQANHPTDPSLTWDAIFEGVVIP